MKFLESNGADDPEDANGTSVSDYIAKFGDYDLGCCSGKLGIQLVDKKKQPISGVHYQVKAGWKVLQEGHSDASGKITHPNTAGTMPISAGLLLRTSETEAANL